MRVTVLTEEEFLTLTRPEEATRLFKSRTSPLRVTTRKARLFVCACCRRVWNYLGTGGWGAVEAGERAADGLIRIKDLKETSVASPRGIKIGRAHLHNPANYAARPFAWVNAEYGAAYAAHVLGWSCSEVYAERRSAEESEWLVQCDLLRDILGNPFRPITLAAVHRTPVVVSLAHAAYDERHLPSGELDLHRLAVLADALEEAGGLAELAAHLRSPGPHVRGCFAVDQCLGLK